MSGGNFMYYPYNKKISAQACVMAAIVGISRVYAGIHHVADIIGSAVIAIVSIWVAKQYILQPNSPKQSYVRDMLILNHYE